MGDRYRYSDHLQVQPTNSLIEQKKPRITYDFNSFVLAIN